MKDTETTGLLNLLADIRAAAGDPEGKLMQDELVAHIADLHAKAETPPEADVENLLLLAVDLFGGLHDAVGDTKRELNLDELMARLEDLAAKAGNAATPEPETAVELAATLSDDIAEVTASILHSMPSGISLISRERIGQHIETSYIAGYMRAVTNQ